MTFIDELKNATNFSVTENGATGYKTTLMSCWISILKYLLLE